MKLMLLEHLRASPRAQGGASTTCSCCRVIEKFAKGQYFNHNQLILLVLSTPSLVSQLPSCVTWLEGPRAFLGKAKGQLRWESI